MLEQQIVEAASLNSSKMVCKNKDKDGFLHGLTAKP